MNFCARKTCAWWHTLKYNVYKWFTCMLTQTCIITVQQPKRFLKTKKTKNRNMNVEAFCVKKFHSINVVFFLACSVAVCLCAHTHTQYLYIRRAYRNHPLPSSSPFSDYYCFQYQYCYTRPTKGRGGGASSAASTDLQPSSKHLMWNSENKKRKSLQETHQLQDYPYL